MTPARFDELTKRYASLRIVVLGDFSLDRYLDIDPARSETSIETGLPVYNVVRVRAHSPRAGDVAASIAMCSHLICSVPESVSERK